MLWTIRRDRHRQLGPTGNLDSRREHLSGEAEHVSTRRQRTHIAAPSGIGQLGAGKAWCGIFGVVGEAPPALRSHAFQKVALPESCSGKEMELTGGHAAALRHSSAPFSHTSTRLSASCSGFRPLRWMSNQSSPSISAADWFLRLVCVHGSTFNRTVLPDATSSA
jgi:hypothetical protein